jgi:uncharacterized peroxidase-related enzyme
MPHIAVPADLPGITSLMAFRPDTGRALSEFAEHLMRGPSPLTQGERELIAARVSDGNECHFCMSSHAAAARHALPDDGTLFAAIRSDIDTAPLTDRMRALLAIADQVRVSGRNVTDEHIAAARDAGLDDNAIHDAVLVAAAFCMFNRYVDGLNTVAPHDDALYDRSGKRLANEGYLASLTPGPGRPGQTG